MMIMQLSNLIAPGDNARLYGKDPDIGGVTADSRNVKAGFLFAAIPGAQQDGRAFIKDAIERGATAVLAPDDTDPKTLPPHVALVTAADPRRALAAFASRYYPRQPAIIAAVTGTSGKTSTVQFAREIWACNGHPSASIGTLGLVTAAESRYGSLTTPDPVTLHHLLDETAGKGITHLAMEASSHGLALSRLDYVRVKAGAFTNLSRDHLDYHSSMEDYLAAKMRLFDALLPEGSPVVLNADAPEFEELSRRAKARRHAVISYGRKGEDIRIISFEPRAQGQRIRFAAMGKDYDVLLPVVGSFQVWNSLCALGVVIGSGEDAAKSVAALEKLTGVPGRLELAGTTATGGAVFVDYAHKPGALENVLTALRPHVTAHPGARLHVVFGCGGNRDKGKRPIMGAIAQRLADEVIVTDDNPRKEIPDTIRQEILAGCTPGPNLREIGDRAKAIYDGMAQLRAGDVLVIAGKGHEKGQIVGDQVLPFDDADVARRALRGEAL